MDTDKKNGISRRDFITALWGIVAALPFLYSTLKFIAPPQRKFKSSSQKLTGNTSSEIMLDSLQVNSSKTIIVEGEPVIVIRNSEKDFTALSAVCTHLNCIVAFKSENRELICTCHGGKYDLNGNVIEGPPKTPLAKYNIKVLPDKLIISS